MITGIILAAGRSTRMGRSKALLMTPGGQTFVSRLVETLTRGGIDAPFVVGRPDDQQLRATVEALNSGARWIENLEADTGGQLSSVLAGLRKADRPGVRALMVVPVDAPMIAVETVTKLAEVFGSTGAPIVRARYRGHNGHPVVFSRAVFDELRRADPSIGAKAVVRAHESTIINVEVDDPGVIGDIDTPEDYERLLTPPGSG